GQSFTEVNVSSNGNLQFTSMDDYWGNACPLPDPLMGIMIVPFWDDLSPNVGGGVYYETTGTAPNRIFTVEWRDVPHYGGTTDGVTFEVQLEEASGRITFLYQDTDFGDPMWNDGASATVG
ncbi:MAG: hypothetical protein C4310_14170, partial [Chloroflexota bacterium]